GPALRRGRRPVARDAPGLAAARPRRRAARPRPGAGQRVGTRAEEGVTTRPRRRRAPVPITTRSAMSSAEDLLRKTTERLAQRRPLPESTSRLQFHAGFTFRDATRLVPYLADLGVTHLYASPFLRARPASKHGYDIVSHQVLNPEIGTEADFADLVGALN